MKKLLIIIFCMLFLVQTASAFEFDNKLTYSKEDMKVNFDNMFGLGKHFGEIELKSHSSVTEIKSVGLGEQVVMYYDFTNWVFTKEGLGKVIFTDMKTRKEIQRDYEFVIWREMDIEDYGFVCNETNDTCSYEVIGTHRGIGWDELKTKDIPKGNNKIGIRTIVQNKDYIDGVWTIIGKEVTKHAEWAYGVEAHGIDCSVTSGSTTGDYYGMKVTIGEINITLTKMTKHSNSGATKAYLWNSARGQIAVADFTGNDAPFNNVLSADTNYYFVADKAGAGYSRSRNTVVDAYPIVSTDLTWIAGWYGASGDSTTYAANIESINYSIEIPIDYPVVTLETPSNYTNFTATNEVDFECYVYDYVNTLANVSLYIDDVLNETVNNPSNATSEWFNKILSEGEHWWTCEVYSNISKSFTAEKFLLDVDTTSDIQMVSPTEVNYYNATRNWIELNLSVTETFFGNLTFDLYKDDVLDISFFVENETRFVNWTGLSDGNYSYNGTIGTTTGRVNSSETRILIIDTTVPEINVTSPTENQYVIASTDPFNVTINWTVSDDHLDSCWINNGTINISLNCSTNSTELNLSSGNQTIIFYANDTLGQESHETRNFFVNYIQEDTTYEDPVIEGSPTNIYLNISATEINSFNGTLYWNNTVYPASSDYSLTNGILNTTLTVPLVSVNTNINLSWIYNLNGVEYNSSVYNHTVYFLTSINVTSLDCSDKALRFDIQDEENLTALYGDIEYNFKYGLTNNSLKTVYGSLTNVTTFYVCINASVSENYTLGYGEIQYRSDDHVSRRYYLFENKILSNNTLANHTLRDLLSTKQTSFLMTFEDTSLNIYEDKYTALWRWYPNLNEYQIVEMGKTDEQGETVSHINTEDTDYRVGIYEKDGTLIKLGDPLRFICASAPCTFVLRVGEGDLDFSSFFEVETALSYNETTKLFTLIYNDPNQLTSEMRLIVTRETGSSSLIICNDTSSGFTGVMTCNTSAYSGIKKALVYRSASPETPIDQLIISTVNNVFKSGFGLFISLFLWLAIVLTGLGNNPLWTIILVVVGLIPALLLGSINIAIFTGVAVLGAIVIHFIKRSLA